MTTVPQPAPAPMEPAAEPLRHSAGAVRKRHLGRWLFVGLCALAVAGYFLASRFEIFGFGKKAAAEKPAARTVPVVTATARQGDLNVYLTSLGTVTAFNMVTIRSRVAGELINVAFNEGQLVKEGDLLAEIDPKIYEVQLAQAEGQLARDQAPLETARRNLERDKKLLAAKANSPQQVDTQQATVGQYEGIVKADQAAVDNAKLQLFYCRITAPISGRIGLRRVDKGNLVQANEPNGLAVITQLQPISVVFTVPQDEIFRVQRKINAGEQLAVDAYNRDLQTKLATGSLQAVDNQVDPATGTVRLKSVFPNEDNALFPNQFVNARLLVETRKNSVIVPTAAVQRGPSSTFTYVVKPDSTVELRTIIVGPTEGSETVIESGLSPGEIVVTEGTDKLQSGVRVEPRKTPQAGNGKPAEKSPKSGKSGEAAE